MNLDLNCNIFWIYLKFTVRLYLETTPAHQHDDCVEGKAEKGWVVILAGRHYHEGSFHLIQHSLYSHTPSNITQSDNIVPSSTFGKLLYIFHVFYLFSIHLFFFYIFYDSSI